MNTPVNTPVDNRAALRPDVPRTGRVAVLTADKVEDVEFFYPYYRFVEEGYDVDVLTPDGGPLTAYRGMRLQATKPLAEGEPADYDLLFIPGGLAPTALRENPEALAFVREFAGSGKPIGAVCHGPQLLAAAGLVEGRSLTSWHEVAPEIVAAGGTYVDEPLVEDGPFLTSRKPGDLPVELHRMLELLGREAAVSAG
ncbi:type 1 glutamine amidotransferase domain-containing protein [Streptomyces sp. NPDC026672]|uniref:type 1 glutamine amidotransferase domain-containing protein n=1 Tax=unclassified Streptomyces TaxID=2593676 RepID=UPI0033C85762